MWVLLIRVPILCAQTYTVKDLGTLDGGDLSAAYGINNAGQVVGSTTGPGLYHATLFSGTGVNNTDLGTLGGSSSVAFSINDAGQMVGEASIITNNNTRATLFSGTGSNNTNLGNLGPNPASDPQSSAYSINIVGQIVGSAIDATGFVHAALFSGTGSNNINLGDAGRPSSQALAINDSGQIVGFANNASDISRPTLFSGTGSNDPISALSVARLASPRTSTTPAKLSAGLGQLAMAQLTRSSLAGPAPAIRTLEHLGGLRAKLSPLIVLARSWATQRSWATPSITDSSIATAP